MFTTPYMKYQFSSSFYLQLSKHYILQNFTVKYIKDYKGKKEDNFIDERSFNTQTKSLNYQQSILNLMTSKSRSSVKNTLAYNQDDHDEKNDFLQKSNKSLEKSNFSNEQAKAKRHHKDQVIQDQEHNNSEQKLADSRNIYQSNHEEGEQEQGENEHVNSQDNVDQNYQSEKQQRNSNKGNTISSPKNSHSSKNNHTRNLTEFNVKQEPQTSTPELKQLLKKFQNQLQALQSLSTRKQNPEADKKTSELQTNIEILQIKIRLQEKLKNRKQLISFERINHLELIFKHYCTHIFKTGKHMTFDRLEYEKVHLTIDRLSVFLKDFNLTTLKMKDNKVRQIIEKQQIIKLFKKISPNCRDLDFEQFIIILQKLAQLYFDCKITYEQRKINQRKQRLKIKQVLERKQKYKQEMLKKHQQKMQRLQKGINDTIENIKQKMPTQSAQNDDIIEKMINEGAQQHDENKQSRVSNQTKNQNLSKGKKSASLYSRTFKKDMDAQLNQKNQNDSLLNLTKQEKIQYFYEIINVDDIQSFSNKMRQLNLPLFKIYAGKQQNTKKQPSKQQRQDEHISVIQESKVQNDDQKRLKQLREKLNQRNQKLKQSSVPSLTKEQYELRKLKRSRLQEQNQGSVKVQRKTKKVDLTEGQINLSSLSKLAYENVNFSKFNPKAFYKKQQDDDIFLQQYGDSPVRTRKPQAKTQIAKYSQNSKRIIQEKDKNQESILLKLKQRQSELEINQKKEQVSQMYRFNDRTQRQKRLIDKFLQKNK